MALGAAPLEGPKVLGLGAYDLDVTGAVIQA